MAEEKSGGVLKYIAAGCGCLLLLVLGGAAALFLALSGTVVASNAGTPAVADLGATYVGSVRSGSLTGKAIDGAGAVVLHDLISQRCSASANPVSIVFQQIWYNTITSGYEGQYWFEPGDSSSSVDQYGVYMSGGTMFLRVEYSGPNQVLSCGFTATDLATALAPHAM